MFIYRSAVQLEKANGIKLIERNELINMISQLDENQTIETVQQTIQNVVPRSSYQVVIGGNSMGVVVFRSVDILEM